jgi:hypothetical protein
MALSQKNIWIAIIEIDPNYEYSKLQHGTIGQVIDIAKKHSKIRG